MVRLGRPQRDTLVRGMWLFTRYGFFSIACARKPGGAVDPDLMMIRARMSEHLEALRSRFDELSGCEVSETPDNDYRYRLLVPKAVWTSIVAALAEEQTWSNFKNEAHRFNNGDRRYYEALHRVWDIMNRLQPL